MTRRKLIILALAIAAAVGLYWYFGRAQGQGQGAGQMPPPVVAVLAVTPRDLPLSYVYAGRVAGSKEVEIRARVSGILLERTYREGDRVQAGQVLFRIDPAPFRAELARAQAQLTQAERDWQRAETLFADQALSAREYDAARATFEQARAAVQTARINLGYTTVRAPFSGVTSRENVSEGALVTADNTLLTRVSILDPVYVNFSIPDQEFNDIRVGLAQGDIVSQAGGGASSVSAAPLTAEIRSGDDETVLVTGTVNFTDSIIDPETGTVSSRAVVNNDGNLLLPGQFVRAAVTGLVRPNAMTVPDRAVMQGPQGTFVYTVMTSDTQAGVQTIAAIRPVVLGELQGSQRLVESGLQAGDRVIAEGMIKVRPGQLVTVSGSTVTDASATTPTEVQPTAQPDGQPGIGAEAPPPPTPSPTTAGQGATTGAATGQATPGTAPGQSGR